MSDACREVEDALAIEPADERVEQRIAAHVARCAACQARVADHARLVEALRDDDGGGVDDVTRARWLAQLAPSIDELATRYARRAGAGGGAGGRARTRDGGATGTTTRWPRWMPIAAAAAAIGVIAIGAIVAGSGGARHAGSTGAGSTGAGSTSGGTTATAGTAGTTGTGSTSPSPATSDLAVLRPYVVAGVATEESATTMLGGRFTALAVADAQLVRVEVGADARIAAIGPVRITVDGADATELRLEVDGGTVLVDQVQGGRTIAVHAPGVAVRAQNARFAVATASDPANAVVFVDRGEIDLGGAPLAAGQWYGPDDRRSVALVTSLRDHGNAIAPATDPSGVIAVGGSGAVVTESGAVLGTAPLWARVPAGKVVLVVADGHERRIPIAIVRGEVVRVEAPPTPPTTAKSSPTTATTAKPGSATATTSTAGSATTGATATTGTTTTIAATTAASETDNSADGLYAAAEAALRDGKRDDARTIWTRLIDLYPRSSQAASAMYDLAGLARARGDIADAQAWLSRLLDGDAPDALREPALYLSCRLDADAQPAAATACFTRFRTSFPDSAHDAEVLAWLTAQAEKTGGCAAARALAEAYLAKHPDGSFAARATQLAACTEAP